MTKRDLAGDGLMSKDRSISLDLKTLQNAIDKNVEITEGDIALDKAKSRLPSLIAATNTKMLNAAHPLEVYEAPPEKVAEEPTKAMSPENLMDLMTTEQLESVV